MPSIAHLISDELDQHVSIEALNTIKVASWVSFPLGDRIIFVFKDYSFLMLAPDGPSWSEGDIPPADLLDVFADALNLLGRQAIHELAKRKIESIIQQKESLQ